MSRLTSILGATLAVALVASYLSWTHAASAPDLGATTVLNVKPEQVTRIVYTRTEPAPVPHPPAKTAAKKAPESSPATAANAKADAKKAAAKKPGSAKADPAKTATAKPANESVPPTPPAPPKPTTRTTRVTLVAKTDAAGRYYEVTIDQAGKVTSFTGGALAKGLVRQLAPLTAQRVLKHVSSDRLKKLGLDHTHSSLAITANGKTSVFEIGETTYGGIRRYMRPEGTDTVDIVRAAPIRRLESGSFELMERAIVGLRRGQVKKVELDSGGKKITMVHVNADDLARAFWAKPGALETKVPEYGNWIGKIFSMRLAGYVQKGTNPGPLETVATLRFTGNDHDETVTLLQGAAKNGQADYYARSTNTRGEVRLRRISAGQVVADLGSVMGDGS